jgi:hypothetical protein
MSSLMLLLYFLKIAQVLRIVALDYGLHDAFPIGLNQLHDELLGRVL